MYEILVKEDLTPVTKLFAIRAPAVARKAQAGQFVIVRTHEKGERIPLTVADADRERGLITLVVQEVGGSTRFACVDGPEFDGHEVNWELLMARQRIYLEQERQAVEQWQNECQTTEAH